MVERGKIIGKQGDFEVAKNFCKRICGNNLRSTPPPREFLATRKILGGKELKKS
jgi:hypothetical protein